jgi:Excalibur calcium-binding domain
MPRTGLTSDCAAVALLLGVAFGADVRAHGGGLDKHGCHTNRKTGEYHCYRGAGPAHATSQESPTFGTAAPHSLTPARGPSVKRGAGNGAFANCAEARAAGAAPVRRGDPGYGAHLDRDGDGVGCEPRRR